MGEMHDIQASFYGDIILSKIRAADSTFKQVFSTSVIRTGDWDWPRPDYVCFDEVLNASYALEFKPPFQTKREYLTGLGQSMSYLQKHQYSGLILPYCSDDGFKIAEFVRDTLLSPEFSEVCTSLYAYDTHSKSIELLRPIIALRKSPIISTASDETKTFWCWWRDMSHYELYDLLNLSFKYADYAGDIYSDYVYPEFYDLMVTQKTKQWDGTPRKKTGSEASRKAEKQNYKIPLVQLELWTRDEGRLTDLGFKMLEIGKKYGPNSAKFLRSLSYLILVNGKHLDLINLVDKFQRSSLISKTSKQHKIDLEVFLTDNGCIGKRKPTAVTTNAKNSYMRDEMKLWNKLGFVERNGRDYFFPDEGYRFNWEHITSILLSPVDI